VKRREFIGVVASTVLAAPRAAEAQLAANIRRIGFVAFNTPEAARDGLGAFRQALRERGWIEGQNVLIEYRFAEGQAARLPKLVAELIQLQVDIIVAASSASTRAARNASQTIPIVMAASADALGEGFVASLAHPRGNVTGMTFLAGPEIAGKQLELLKALTPGASRLAVLANPSNGSHAAFVQEVIAAAPKLGVQLQVLQVRAPDQLEPAFSAMSRQGAAALLVLTDSMFLGQRRAITENAAKNNLPTMYSQREYVDVGGLVSYGPNLTDMFRRSAAHVDKILRGAKAADLPVEQPTKFELVINQRTAKALGLTIPQSVLLRADEVLE
jgi:putative ABC transport system substrate-binding protein